MKITTTTSLTNANAITHTGVFHSDEIFGTVILSKVFEELSILRTFKVPDDIDDNTLVYDIGFGKFDHHQKGGNGCRENGIPYAACGLLWKEFGPQIVKNTSNPELVWSLIDRDLIQGVDSVDNGVMPKVDFPAQAMTISQAISGFNPSWDSSESSDEAFIRAVAFAEVVFDNVMRNAISKAAAQSIVENAIDKSEGNIMVLDQFVPWQEFIFSSTSEKAGNILFVVFPSNRGGYNWQAVPTALGSFSQRKEVPDEWKGLNGSDLQQVTGIATASFCHSKGFLGATDTLEDAIAFAKLAVNS